MNLEFVDSFSNLKTIGRGQSEKNYAPNHMVYNALSYILRYQGCVVMTVRLIMRLQVQLLLRSKLRTSLVKPFRSLILKITKWFRNGQRTQVIPFLQLTANLGKLKYFL